MLNRLFLPVFNTFSFRGSDVCVSRNISFILTKVLLSCRLVLWTWAGISNHKFADGAFDLVRYPGNLFE